MATGGSHGPTRLVILAGLLPGLLAATLAAAPQMVRRTVYVTALDRGGRPVPGLTADDFRVKEDGRVRGIAQAEVATQPMQIALLIDDGGPSLAAIRQATGQFVERLQHRAEFSLTTTGGQPQTRVNFTGDPRRVYEALQGTFANVAPTTKFLDVVLDTARSFVLRRIVRPVIVAIASEGEELSASRSDAVLEAVQQSGAVFYYIGLGAPVTSGTRPALGANRAADSTEYESVQRNIVIGSAPKNSGGRSEQVFSPGGIEPLMLEFAAELAGQYAITYETDVARARLEVTALRSGIRLRAPARVGGK
jgi:VWFA-related protein